MANSLPDMISGSVSTQLIKSDFSTILESHTDRGYISLNINPIPFGQIPTGGFKVCVLLKFDKISVMKLNSVQSVSMFVRLFPVLTKTPVMRQVKKPIIRLEI